MTWTDELKLDYLVKQVPWTIIPERSPEGELLLRVVEIRSAMGSGDSEREASDDLWESLTESLRAYLHFGDDIPMPKHMKPLPWLSVQPRGNLVVAMRRNAEMFPDLPRTSQSHSAIETELAST